MVKKVLAIAIGAVLMSLPLGALAAQHEKDHGDCDRERHEGSHHERVESERSKNHGQCVSACVHDLGIYKNKVCSDMCKAGTYPPPVVPPPVVPPPPAVTTGGTLPVGAPCDAANDQCAAPATCQPTMPGFPTYNCK